MREHGAAGGVTRPADPDRRQVTPKARCTATAPEATDKPDVPPIEVKPAAPFQDL